MIGPIAYGNIKRRKIVLKNDAGSLPPPPPRGGPSLFSVFVIPGQTPASSLSFSSMTNALHTDSQRLIICRPTQRRSWT